jgi:hypothetical protein
VGTRGSAAKLGATCDILFTVYRLSPGAYFKYSSGGQPIFLFSTGYGSEGQDDVGVPYSFVLGAPLSLPMAVAPAVVGMRAGGVRRVLVPPALGWTSGACAARPLWVCCGCAMLCCAVQCCAVAVLCCAAMLTAAAACTLSLTVATDRVQPRPPTFGASRRLANHADEPLLFEVELQRVRGVADDEAAAAAGADADALALPAGSAAYRTPLPPALSPAGASRQAMYDRRH